MKNINYEIRFGFDVIWIERMIVLYNKTEMKRNDPQKVLRAFVNSQVVVSVWFEESMLGIGRMITDFEMYSAIFDVVIDPDFQKKGLGKLVMDSLISKAPQTCIHLTSTFGNEFFYKKLGFKFHKTAMALYPTNLGKSKYLDWER